MENNKWKIKQSNKQISAMKRKSEQGQWRRKKTNEKFYFLVLKKRNE